MKKTMLAHALAAAALLAGCQIPEVSDPGVTIPTLPVPGAAVIVGLTAVESASYGGWAGDCPGCDIDADRMASAAVRHGLTTVTLRNAQATRFRFLSACASAAKAVEPAAKAGLNPLVLVYISGHGGQSPDANGDEADGQDETLCLWDGQLTDDLLYLGLCEFPAGSRVAFISDTCNSGTNFKAPRDRVSAMRARASRAPGVLKCSFVHIGGCGDGESSYGGLKGGEATTALLKALEQRPAWKNWVPLAQAFMPRNQRLSYAELNGGFGDMEAMR